jgi:hypothetical protein
VNEACKMLVNGSLNNIADVAYSCGFSSITNFNYVFKNIAGKSPRDYINDYSGAVKTGADQFGRLVIINGGKHAFAGGVITFAIGRKANGLALFFLLIGQFARGALHGPPRGFVWLALPVVNLFVALQQYFRSILRNIACSYPFKGFYAFKV